MGLLDDLKKQADLVKTQQILQQNLQGDKLKLVEDKKYFDTMHFFVKWAGPDTLVIEKDMPPAMQRIRESLWLSKVKFVEEEKKNAKGFVIGAKFTVPAAVLTDIVIKADHEQGKLHF